MAKQSEKQFPAYLTTIYRWLYFNPKVYNFLNNPIVLNILTLGSHSRMVEELIKEISPSSSILQTGVTLGYQIEKAYSAMDMKGTYTIIDILPHMLEKCHEKHPEKRIVYQQENTAKTIKGKYDIIICYMLLHEMPPQTCTKTVNNILNALAPGGKAVFIDYHCPSSLNPLKYLIRAFNRLYQPFAEALWKTDVKDMSPQKENFIWSKQTYFGGMYQKTVAARKS